MNEIKEFNEAALVDNQELRERLVGRVKILDKVKKLLLLPKLEMMTSQQVADYYEVPVSTLRNCYTSNKAEIDGDGTEVKPLSFWKSDYPTIKNNVRGSVTFRIDEATAITVPNAGIRMFSRRAILRIGMLLRDSKVAKEVRTQLLNTVEHTTDEQRTADVDEEKALIAELGRAYFYGDFDMLSEASMKLNAFNRRHIERLTEQVTVLEPKGAYYDHVLQAEGLTPITVIAKDYGWSAQRMNRYLSDKNVQFKRDGTWVLYQKYADQGYTGTKTCTYKNFNGKDCASINTCWTQAGRLFIYNLLKEDGILPMMERNAG